MSHYDDFHEKKASEEAQRQVFKQEEPPVAGGFMVDDFGENPFENTQEFRNEWERWCKTTYDPVENPLHYCDHPSGIECIEITEHFNFCLGNAVKYIWRSGLKTENSIEDLKKAVWYIQREIKRIGG